VPEEADLAKDEKCEFIPFCLPKAVVKRDGKIAAIELYKTDYTTDDRVEVDEGNTQFFQWILMNIVADQFIRLKCDFVISAFGSQAASKELTEALAPLTFDKNGFADIDKETMNAKVMNVYRSMLLN
jgi:dihydropyrimidine dehydrogenase (NADP+)